MSERYERITVTIGGSWRDTAKVCLYLFGPLYAVVLVALGIAALVRWAW